MTLQRHFLDDTTPALHQAVSYLRSHYPPGRTWDLHDLTIAVPGRRAVRRLTELLVESAGDSGLLPPTIVTTGQLPEQLYEPDLPIASDLVANLSWIATARATPEFTALLPHPPEPEDLTAWWSLAAQFRGVVADLAAAGLRPSEVPPLCVDHALALPEPERWHALDAIDTRHVQLLMEHGVVETHASRRDALTEGRCCADGEVILLGVVDMTPLLGQMLRSIEKDVTALIHAPAELEDAFDELGAIVVDHWVDRPVGIDDHQLHVVDRPFDQGRQVAETIAAHSGTTDLTVEDITVGLSNENDVDAIRHPLELAGLPTRYAAGRPMSESPPVTLLVTLAQLAQHRRVADLAALLRHPDVLAWLHAAGGDSTDWLTLLDDYSAEHLQDRITGDWLGHERRAGRLGFLWRRISALIPEEPGQVIPLPEWCDSILKALAQIFGGMSFKRENESQRPTLRALESITSLVSEHQQLDPTNTITPSVTFTAAIGLLLQRLEGEIIPEDAGTPAVEMLGFLELPLDDARELVITGLNEGYVPAVRSSDPLLPDHLRQILGLDDNRRRYARSACVLSSILRSRPSVTLISGRTTSDGDPLIPSRLLLACDSDTRVRRLDAFYRTSGTDADVQSLLLVPGDKTTFYPTAPPPDDDTPLPDRLSVTGFRDYIACPYRFYLRRVLKLAGPTEPGDEMDGALFGTLGHDVLQRFGESKEATSKKPSVIEDCLFQALEELAAERFGNDPRPALSVQLDQLRLRLHHFASAQARIVSAGWSIHSIELDERVPFDVDGIPFTLSGRIDRIDVHPKHGVRIIDYKTSDTAKTPEQTHRRAKTDWLDLQLPLYRELARPLGLEGPVELAYFNLPRRPEELRLSVAEWVDEEIDEAVDHARAIIRVIRRRRFWPPGDPSQYGDEFVRLCADNALNRTELFEIASHDRATG
jgi:ATP-dependent helicase/nuclease subunit B